jgi:hypothetical protein
VQTAKRNARDWHIARLPGIKVVRPGRPAPFSGGTAIITVLRRVGRPFPQVSRTEHADRVTAANWLQQQASVRRLLHLKSEQGDGT